MFISLFVTLTLLPALLGAFPLNLVKQSVRKTPNTRYLSIANLPITHNKHVKILAAIILIASCFTIPGLRFDPNILNLQNPENESVQTYQDLLESSDTTPWNGG